MDSFEMDEREQALKVHRFRKRIVGEQGASKIGCLLIILVVIVIGYGVYKFGPPYMGDQQLRNAAIQIAGYAAAGVLAETKYGTGRGRGEIEQIREAVLTEAIELQIPLTRDNILVEKEVDRVSISVKYMVPISLPWEEFNWNFEYTIGN
jgi:hypothetical protein